MLTLPAGSAPALDTRSLNLTSLPSGTLGAHSATSADFTSGSVTAHFMGTDFVFDGSSVPVVGARKSAKLGR